MTEPYTGLLPTPLANLAPYVQDGILGSMFYGEMVRSRRMLHFFAAEPSYIRRYPGQVGQLMYLTRDARHRPDPNPSQPGVNPTPSTHVAEQFRVRPQMYDGKIWLDKLTNFLASGDRAEREIKNFIKTNAAQKIDRVAARASYGTYNGGHTLATTSAGPSTALVVASINGFTETIDANGQVQPVSVANPKWININGTMRQITAAVAADPANSPFGTGTLTLAVAHTWTANDYVIAQDAPSVIYSGGGFSVDAISAADTLTYDDIIRAVSQLRANGCEPFADGLYRCMLSPEQEGQLLRDPKIESYVSERGLSESMDPEVREATIAIAAGVRFMRCNQVPDRLTALDMPAAPGGIESGVRGSAELSREIWAEVSNLNGIEIGRVMIYGREAGELHYIPTGELEPEGGMLSMELPSAQVQASGDGIFIWPQPWIRFLFGKPLDDHQLRTPLTWVSFLDTVVPSDFYGGRTAFADLSTVGGRNPRYKRAVTILHARNS